MLSPRLSIIIVSHNCAPLLRDCIASIYASDLARDVEIIVVDNKSTDGTIELVRSQFPEVRLVANAANVGFPAANNQGIRIATAQHFLLLNPDTVVHDHALSTLTAFLEGSDAEKVAGPDVRNADGSPQDTVHWHWPSGLQFVARQVIPSAGAGPDRIAMRANISTPTEVAWVSGCAIAFPRAVYERVGPLDDDLFWAEDMDYCLRAKRAGIPVYYVPNARITHYVGQSGKQNYRRMLYAQHVSRVIFADRHYGLLVSVALRGLMTLMLPVKMAFRVIQFGSTGRRRESRERFLGYWDALRFCVLSW